LPHIEVTCQAKKIRPWNYFHRFSRHYSFIERQGLDALGVSIPAAYRKYHKFFPNHPENPLLKKSRFSGPFRKKLLSYSETTSMLFRTLPVAPAAKKVSANEKLPAIAIIPLSAFRVMPARFPTREDDF
jgi:hypothetical protein